jgi:hypothetical protein
VIRSLLLFLLIGCVVGCGGSTPPAPVEESKPTVIKDKKGKNVELPPMG